MPDHSRFEELCALSLVGQISANDSSELQAHLKECPTCRTAAADFVEIESMWLTPDTESTEVGSTLNQRILSKMQAAGAQFSKPVLKAAGARPRLFSFPALKIPTFAFAAAILLALGGLIGFALAQRFLHSTADQVVLRIPTPAKPEVRPSSPSVNSDNREAAEDLTGRLASAEAELSRTRSELKEAERRLATLQDGRDRSAAEIAGLKATVEQARNDANNAQAQVAKLRDLQSSQAADLVAAQYRAREAEDKLADETAALDRERQLLGAGRDIRDIIAARNLHIVDVADVSNSGVKKPFGRVFYTEGKSLIFYAYDLANTRGKQAFTAWGQREGDPRSTRALGILINDDQAQKRWALKFNDPNVLAEIDSVFVTLEPNDKPGSEPKGKKLLNAYLGTPANHP